LGIDSFVFESVFKTSLLSVRSTPSYLYSSIIKAAMLAGEMEMTNWVDYKNPCPRE